MGEFIRVGGLKGRTEFVRLLEERFPAIAEQIDDFERGLLHMEMSVFARATCEAIERDDRQQVQEHLTFVDELMSGSSPELENAIYVSYLEEVFLIHDEPRYLSARRLLSDRLQSVLIELEEHWRNVAEMGGKTPPS